MNPNQSEWSFQSELIRVNSRSGWFGLKIRLKSIRAWIDRIGKIVGFIPPTELGWTGFSRIDFRPFLRTRYKTFIRFVREQILEWFEIALIRPDWTTMPINPSGFFNPDVCEWINLSSGWIALNTLFGLVQIYRDLWFRLNQFKSDWFFTIFHQLRYKLFQIVSEWDFRIVQK